MLALCVFAAASARALSPPAPAKAELVYANGGRIMSIKADGSDRKVLTDGGQTRRFVTYNFRGDLDPQISPDGKKLLFTRIAKTGRRAPVTKFLVTDRNGANAVVVRQDDTRALFRQKKRKFVDLVSPSWSADSEEIVFTRIEEWGVKVSSAVIAVALDGRQRTISRFKPVRTDGKNEPRVFANPVVSPDGGSLLVGVSSLFGQQQSRLDVIDLATGKRRVLAPNAVQGSWSPDGDRVVMSVPDHGKDVDRMDIATIDADGSDRRVLYRSRGDDSDPVWSADGTRIAFNSTRNYPSGYFSQEIYTITPEGECLTWLTNGSPESRSPSWSPDPLASTDPDSCGDGGREATVEEVVRAKKRALPGTQLWAGEQIGSMIYSGGDAYRGGSYIQYGDCAAFERRDCRPDLTVSTYSLCAMDLGFINLFAENGKFRPGSWKGHPYWSYRLGRSEQVDLSMVDGAIVYSMTSPPGGVAANRHALSNLKRIGSDRGVKLSTRPSLPAKAIRRLRSVSRTFDRTGDVSSTAAVLGIKKAGVRRALRAGSVIARFGEPKVLNCPSKDGNGFDSDSSDSSDRARGLDGPIG